MSSIPAMLSEEWLPDKLLVRNDKLELLKKLVEKPSSRSVYVFGPRGVGKSLTCKFLVMSYPSDRALYVRCMGGLDQSIRHALLEKLEVGRRPLFEVIAKNFSLMVVDDLNNLYNYKKALYFLQSLYNFNVDRHLAVVLVSTWSFEQFQRDICPSEVFSRYYFAPVGFGVYSVDELATILKQRVEKAFESYEEGALKFIAAKTLRLGGDMRLALRILQNSWVASKQLKLDVAEKAWYLEKKRYWRDEVLLSLDGHTALLLWLIARYVNDQGKVLTNALYRRYEEVCKELRVAPLYEERLHYCLSKLERLGYIARSVLSLGRQGGRQSEITLLFDEPSIIVEAGEDLKWSNVLF